MNQVVFVKDREVMQEIGKLCKRLGSCAGDWEVVQEIRKLCRKLGSCIRDWEVV